MLDKKSGAGRMGRIPQLEKWGERQQEEIGANTHRKEPCVSRTVRLESKIL